MPVYDARNVLHIGPPERPGDPEVTEAMAEVVRARIRARAAASSGPMATLSEPRRFCAKTRAKNSGKLFNVP
jgi:hypothetical protein